jgi:undecaprenyl diphosphate synthase
MSEDLSQLGLVTEKMPAHVAIIMDGNGRWAKRRFLPRNAGHRQGAEAFRETLKACMSLGIKHLSVYVFSTENWRRPEQEVGFLMDLLGYLIDREIVQLKKNGVRMKVLGRIQALPEMLQEKVAKLEAETADNTTIQANLLINYGGRAEIVDAIKEISQEVLQGHLMASEIDELCVSQHMYTREIPDPDLLIRTGGDFRVSNFLLWQAAYTELVITDTLWPDFGKDTLIDAIRVYQGRDRRFGGVHEK